jgi:capsular polysaccharide transport system ATP-binding protein
MIVFDNVTKTLTSGHIRTTVLNEATLSIPTDRRVAIIGHHGSGKTTLIQLIAGILTPTSGAIERHARVSFPVGYAAGFRSQLTMRQNLAHSARLYGADIDEVTAFVSAVTESEDVLDQPLGRLPQQMRLCFAYAVGYAIPFDVYLFDNLIAVGNADFRQKCFAMFEARSQSSGVLIATRDVRVAARHADMGAVISDGKIELYENVKDAISKFESLGEVRAVSNVDPGAESIDDNDDEEEVT